MKPYIKNIYYLLFICFQSEGTEVGGPKASSLKKKKTGFYVDFYVHTSPSGEMRFEVSQVQLYF